VGEQAEGGVPHRAIERRAGAVQQQSADAGVVRRPDSFERHQAAVFDMDHPSGILRDAGDGGDVLGDGIAGGLRVGGLLG
jgi:hypothetical protein